MLRCHCPAVVRMLLTRQQHADEGFTKIGTGAKG